MPGVIEDKANFNPHSHAGSDKPNLGNNERITISIHTPTQGVTTNRPTGRFGIGHFNPHSHAGSDS